MKAEKITEEFASSGIKPRQHLPEGCDIWDGIIFNTFLMIFLSLLISFTFKTGQSCECLMTVTL